MNEHDERARKQGGNKEERRKDVLTIWFDGALRGHRLHVKGANDFQRPVPNFNRPVSGPRDHFLLPHHLHGRHHPTVGGHLKTESPKAKDIIEMNVKIAKKHRTRTGKTKSKKIVSLERPRHCRQPS